MTDFPSNPAVPTFISSYSKYMLGPQNRLLSSAINNPAAKDWTANYALYMPLYLPWPYNVCRVFAFSGNTTLSGNFDVGIYTMGGARIYSTGSTAFAFAASSAPLYVTADVLLNPGPYFLAYACDTGGASSSRYFGAGPGLAPGRMMGVLQQTSAFPLPSSATFAAFDSTTACPLIGITNTASGF